MLSHLPAFNYLKPKRKCNRCKNIVFVKQPREVQRQSQHPLPTQTIITMPYLLEVNYPNESDLKFDMDYYLETHMPLVDQKWGPYGLQNWKIVKLDDGPDGAKSLYAVQAILTFETREDANKALTSSAATDVFGDIPNFSNKGPVRLTGSVLASSAA